MRQIGLFIGWVFCCAAWAGPVEQSQVELAARGWLRGNPAPMEQYVSQQTSQVKSYSDPEGRILYYVVEMEPQGFVVLSSDDAIEPVIAFSETGRFMDAPDNPLVVLLRQDMQERLACVRVAALAGDADSNSVQQEDTRAANKDLWRRLIGSAAATAEQGEIQAAGMTSVSDVRVAPLLQVKWGQDEVDGQPCYNYYTPNQYPTGCVATAMAQLMRHYAWPTAGIGVHSFKIHVNDVEQYWNTRGGDGAGGPYSWNEMPYDPLAGGLTLTQRQAIGALCYDAGLSVGMGYTPTGSGAGVGSANDALKNTFGYSNSIFSNSFSSAGDAGLWGMVNADLDAALPVLLGISGPGVGHAVVVDGYGYNSGLMYHHLNMGWGGLDNAWYQLPNFTAGYTFNAMTDCVYNIYVSGTGEIISGRITSMAGLPLEGVTVTAYQGATAVKQTTTNSRGVFALKNLASNTSFRISAVKSGYAFADKTASTGKSQDWNAASGNIWGISFVATNATPPTVMDATVDCTSMNPVTIELEALDDHQHSPPDKLTYIIVSLPEHGFLSQPGYGSITTSPWPLAAGANSVVYTPCPYYGGQDIFTFKANDGGVSPTGGDSNIAAVTLNVDNTVTAGFGTDSNIGTNTMINTTCYAARSQALYLNSDIGASKYITDLAVYFFSTPITLDEWTIRMQHTTMSYYEDVVSDFLTTGWTMVYQGDVTVTAEGWYNFHFQTPFLYDGVNNLLIDFSFSNTEISGDTGLYLFHDVQDSRVTTIVTENPQHTSPLTWDFWYNGGYYYGGGWLPSIQLIGTLPIQPMVGDFDASCDVKLPDLMLLSAAWMSRQGQAHYNPACDISAPKNQAVDIGDLAVFANHWMDIYAF